MSDHTVVSVDGEDVRISSPGRVVFHEQGWTKLDVVEHLVRVARSSAGDRSPAHDAQAIYAGCHC